MRICCLKCGREGNLPGHLDNGAYSLRCRRCGGRFQMVCCGPEAESRNERFPLVPASGAHEYGAVTRGRGGMFFADIAEDDSGELELGPGDSHYELHAVLEDADDDARDGLEALATVPRVPEEVLSGAPGANGVHVSSPERLSSKLLDAWRRSHVVAGLGFAALSLLIVGLLVVSLIRGAPTMGAATLALIVGMVGTIGLVLMAFTVTAQNLMLADLLRSIHGRGARSLADSGQPAASRSGYPHATVESGRAALARAGTRMMRSGASEEW